jgi:hypothetical protein
MTVPDTSLDMGAQCEFCAGKSFRRSRFQAKDVMPLLFLRYPVRCLSCSKRQGVNVMVAQRAVPSTVKQVRTAKSTAQWSGWNAAEMPGRTVAPSTAEGNSFSALPVRAPIAMPELRGVTLKHVGPSSATETIKQ